MSEKTKIVKNFCDRFLTIDKQPKSFSEILDLPVNHLKECNEKDVHQLNANHIKTIRDLSKIEFKNIEKIAAKTELPETNLRKWVLAAQLVNRAWIKRANYLKKEGSKIAVLGLDNAGKTSMLECLSGASSLNAITDLSPTVGVDVRKIESETSNLIIWDFGGQVDHRHDYLQSPEEYFLQLDLVLFVIDMQNEDRFDESIEYFKQIFDVITYLKEHPYVLILLHKSDPDFVKDPDYQINVEYIQDILVKYLHEKQLSFEIIPTSIYNFYSTEPDFASTFKRYFAKKKTQKSVEESLEGLSEMLLKVSTTMIEEFKNIKNLLETRLQESKEPLQVSKSGAKSKQIEHVGASQSSNSAMRPPPPPPKPIVSNILNPADLRGNLMSEIKDFFKKRGLTEQNE